MQTNLNPTQIEDQMFLFEGVMNSTNMPKLGIKLLGDINGPDSFNLIYRYLRAQGVTASMIHPESRKFYSEIMRDAAIMSYWNSLNTTPAEALA